MALEIVHEAGAPARDGRAGSEGRFVVRVDGMDAYLVYERRDDVCDILHTFTPPALRGRDIAAALTRAAVEWAHGEGLRIQPTCSYTRTWLARHPEFRR